MTPSLIPIPIPITTPPPARPRAVRVLTAGAICAVCGALCLTLDEAKRHCKRAA